MLCRLVLGSPGLLGLSIGSFFADPRSSHVGLGFSENTTAIIGAISEVRLLGLVTCSSHTLRVQVVLIYGFLVPIKAPQVLE